MHGTSSYVELKWSIREFQYEESLLLRHLATEFCHHQEDNSSADQGKSETVCKLLCQLCFRSCSPRGHEHESSADHQKDDSKRICKLLSDYMFYLLVTKATMLAPVLGNWNIVFQDTCAEAKRLFKKHNLSYHSKACETIVSMKPKFRSITVKGNRSKSVLFDACILARQLQQEAEQWEIKVRVWVELLSYAAIGCRPFAHAQQLSKGGELLTFTWLLMNHLGLGTQFAEQEQQDGINDMATIIE